MKIMFAGLKNDSFTILAAFIVGMLQFTILFGYNVMGFTVESVMHSVRTRCPDCIVNFAGYYGQCVVYIFYTFSNFIAPGILHAIGIRKTLIIASLCFVVYTMSFLYINNFVYFPAAALGGFGFSLYYVGAGTYSAKHSTELTFSRNQAIYWTVAQFCMCPVGVLMIVSSRFSSDNDLNENTTMTKGYRHYSEMEIDLMTYGALGVQLVGLLLAISAPMREIPNSIFSKRHTKTLREQLGNMFKNIAHLNFILLAPLHLFGGMYIAFWLTIYPTTVAFNSDFAENSNLIGYICIAFTTGGIAIGAFISFAHRHFKEFGLWPVFGMTLGGFVINILIWVLFSPPLSSIRPTEGDSIISSNLFIVILLAVLNGIVDGCLNNVRMVISAKVLPTNPAIAFSISKFYQASASATFYFVSSLMTVYQLAALLTVTLTLGTIGFMILMRRLEQNANKIVERKVEPPS